jgi:hypothetical protein
MKIKAAVNSREYQYFGLFPSVVAWGGDMRDGWVLNLYLFRVEVVRL